MTKTISGWVGVCVAIASWGIGARAAHADLGACGDIHVEAKAECTVVPPGATCEAMCEPISVKAACAGHLAADCRARCNKLPSVTCQGTCQASCEADCDKLEPGKFDCEGSCQVDCSGRCSASCESSSDKTKCEASCEGSCAASCNANCEAEPPQVDCKAGCDGSCKGSCEVDPNLDCQASCQAEGEVKCEADIEGGCKAQCKAQEGALFCDGQYVDHGDNLQECVDALEATLNAHVMVEASGSSSCDDAGTCKAEGHVSASSICSVASPGAADGGTAGGLSLLGLAGLLIARRRRTH
ncbi:MAG TPA: hypothetical protein VHM19_09220 [Polyangiales bacterium]|jgi:MYXO-CTERM domain-containing protein|nr:hypothetical protein [Polyangiales bacterium]